MKTIYDELEVRCLPDDAQKEKKQQKGIHFCNFVMMMPDADLFPSLTSMDMRHVAFLGTREDCSELKGFNDVLSDFPGFQRGLLYLFGFGAQRAGTTVFWIAALQYDGTKGLLL